MTIGAENGLKEVVILGAGFSRAISANLPLANELGDLSLALAKENDPNLFTDEPEFNDQHPFETWLSLLADNQPYLDEGANRLNAARFSILTSFINKVLGERQSAAIAIEAPLWLYDLVSVFHRRKTTIVTFNYDTLLEIAVNSTHLGRSRIEDGLPSGFDGIDFTAPVPIAQSISSDDIIGASPPLVAGGPRRSEQSMELLKLHGSLGWWWVPNDESGTTVAREELVSQFTRPAPMAEGRGPLPGREPFIVPPLATKSSYFRNPVIRDLWGRAFDALAVADRVTLIGYSLPLTDTVTGGLLERAIRGREVFVDVVDIHPDAVVDRLTALGGPTPGSDELVCFSGEEAVPTFAKSLCEESAKDVPPVLSRLSQHLVPGRREAAVVSWSRTDTPEHHRVTSMALKDDGTLILTTDPWLNYGSEPDPSEPTTAELVAIMGSVEQIVARSPSGHAALIIDFQASRFDDPNGRQVLYLVPAGKLR